MKQSLGNSSARDPIAIRESRTAPGAVRLEATRAPLPPPCAVDELDEFIDRGLEYVAQATRDLQSLVDLLQLLQRRARAQALVERTRLAEAEEAQQRLAASFDCYKTEATAQLAELQQRLAARDAERQAAALEQVETTEGWRHWVVQARAVAGPRPRELVDIGPWSRRGAPDGLHESPEHVDDAETTVTIRRVPDTSHAGSLQHAIQGLRQVTSCQLREFAAGTLVLDVRHAHDYDLGRLVRGLVTFDLRLVSAHNGAIELQLI